jgi:hypothetical protein
MSFGTDRFGWEIYARVVCGARLWCVVAGVSITTAMGCGGGLGLVLGRGYHMVGVASPRMPWPIHGVPYSAPTPVVWSPGERHRRTSASIYRTSSREPPPHPRPRSRLHRAPTQDRSLQDETSTSCTRQRVPPMPSPHISSCMPPTVHEVLGKSQSPVPIASGDHARKTP